MVMLEESFSFNVCVECVKLKSFLDRDGNRT